MLGHTKFSFASVEDTRARSLCLRNGHTPFTLGENGKKIAGCKGKDSKSTSNISITPYDCFKGWTIIAFLHGSSEIGLPQNLLVHNGSAEEREPMGYFFWLLRLGDVNVLVDTGFTSEKQANAFGIKDHVKAIDLLDEVGLTPVDIDYVILSHCHWDHSGGLSDFSSSRIILRRAEFEWIKEVCDQCELKPKYATGWCHKAGLGDPGKDLFAFGVCKNDYASLVRAKNESRMELLDGEGIFEVVKGIWTVGNSSHTPGSQFIVVQGSYGKLISLAVDTAYLYKNIELPSPIGSCRSTSVNLSSIKQMKKLSSVVVPGHDLKICKKFRQYKPRIHIIDIGAFHSIGDDAVSHVFDKAYESKDKSRWLKPIEEFQSYSPDSEQSGKNEGNWISESAMQNQFLNTNTPVVVRKVSKGSDKKCFHWNLEYLREKCEDNMVIVRKETNEVHYRQGTRLPIEKMTFGKYATQLIEKQECSRKLYLAACNVKKALPQVNDEVYVPPFVKKIHKGPFLWVAPQSHYEFCHFDPDDGLLVVLSGRKTVRLFSPKYVREMYPNPLGSYGRTIQSSVDQIGTKPDLQMYPAFSDVCGFETVLEDGDMLYIPAFWWHQVVSDEMTLSLNIFWGCNTFLSKVQFNPDVRVAFDYWILNICEQNREFSSFYKVIVNFNEQVRRFLFNTWAEMISYDFSEEIRLYVFEYLLQTIMPSDVFYSEEKPNPFSDLPPPDVKHSQRLKIRGLMHRSGKGVSTTKGVWRLEVEKQKVAIKS